MFSLVQRARFLKFLFHRKSSLLQQNTRYYDIVMQRGKKKTIDNTVKSSNNLHLEILLLRTQSLANCLSVTRRMSFLPSVFKGL